jgi:hypothetical protein
MRDITASGSFRALAEAIRINEVAKARHGSGPILPEPATVIAAH